MTGNGDIVARVTSQTVTNSAAKAGVMLRESLAANAPYAAVLITPGSGVTFQRRATAGGATTSTTTAGIVVPVYLRLQRSGSTITAQRSADGLTWTTIGTDTIAFPGTPIYSGLAVTSRNAASVSTVTFTNVVTTGNVRSTTSPSYARGYVYGSYVDELLAILPASGVVGDRKFVHSNHLYSVAALTDNSGNVVERYRYDAYGQRTVLAADGVTVRASSSYGNQVGFTGRYLDRETGLWYFRARYYSGSLGRFVNRDPLGYVDGMNLYAAYYVPNKLDPYGQTVNITGDTSPQPKPPGRGIGNQGSNLGGTFVTNWNFKFDCEPCVNPDIKGTCAYLDYKDGEVSISSWYNQRLDDPALAGFDAGNYNHTQSTKEHEQRRIDIITNFAQLTDKFSEAYAMLQKCEKIAECFKKKEAITKWANTEMYNLMIDAQNAWSQSNYSPTAPPAPPSPHR